MLLKYLLLSVLRVAHKVAVLILCLLVLLFSLWLARSVLGYYSELPGSLAIWTIGFSIPLIYGCLKVQQFLQSYLAKSQPDAFFQLREGTTRDFIAKSSLMPVRWGQDNIFMILPMAGMLALVALPVFVYLKGEYGLLEKALTFVSIPFFIQVGITTSYLFDLHKAHKI